MAASSRRARSAKPVATLWISGDTVLYDGVRQVGARLDVGLAVLHLGEARFHVTGPVRYTMDVQHGLALCREVRPRTIVPVHYEGWSHFREGRGEIEAAVVSAEPALREAFRLVKLGEAVELEVGAATSSRA